MTNDGRSTAHNVRLYLVSINNTSVQSTNWSFDKEVIDCYRANIDQLAVDIPSKTWRFADLFYLISKVEGSNIAFTGKSANNIPGNIERLHLVVMVGVG